MILVTENLMNLDQKADVPCDRKADDPCDREADDPRPKS